MASLHLTSFIKAPVNRVFDLSRSISLHKISTLQTHERAIAGTTTGLIKVGETVTWEAKHLFRTRRFTLKVTAMEIPDSFTDEMILGDFKQFHHEHYFKSIENGTIMIDKLQFEISYGVVGKFFNELYLKKYLKQLIEKRNGVIKEYAETGKWKTMLN